MNVSLVTETFSPEINGVANTLGYWVDGMKSKGIQVQIIRPTQSPQDNDKQLVMESHITVSGLPIPGYKDLKFGLPCTRKLRRLWKKKRPDAIYVATEGPLGWSAARAARSLNIPILSGFHTNFQSYSRFYGLGWLEKIIFAYLRSFHNKTKGTVVPTKNQRDELSKAGFQNVHVLSRGVDCQKFSPNHRQTALRNTWGASSQDVVFIYVGRIAPEKNVCAIVDLYNEAEERGKPFKLVMVGDGPLKQKIQTENPEIIFAGMRTGQDLAEHYASADVFLFPSKTDTFGNVVTEAMASRLAIVSFDDAAAHEHLIHQQSGLLAPLNDDKKFQTNALSLIDNNSEVETLRTRAHALAQDISWTTILKGLISHLLGEQISSEENNYGDDQDIRMV